MPKFLDAPQWYTSSGTLVDMGKPGTGVAGKYFGTNSAGTIGYYNNQFASLNETVPSGAVIYAPTSRGSSGQILKSNGLGAPTWGEYYGFKTLAETGSSYSDSSGGELDVVIPKLTTSNNYDFYFSGFAYAGSSTKLTMLFGGHGSGNRTTVAYAEGSMLAIGQKGIEGKAWCTDVYRFAMINSSKDIRLTYRLDIFTDSVFENLTLGFGAVFYSFRDL